MAKTLQQYLADLDERSDITWPTPPPVEPLKAEPYTRRMPGIRGVLFSAYGTLLRIDHGQLLHEHPEPLRMQLALEKTVQEFNMWNSMIRRPGAPWEVMKQQYDGLIDDAQIRSVTMGETPEIESHKLWGKVVSRLRKNQYNYDSSEYGDETQLAQKIAYFFHASLQGVEASDGALEVLKHLREHGRHTGLLGDGQSFTVEQTLKALRGQGTLDTIQEAFHPDCITLSHELGVRKPSESLYKQAVRQFRGLNVSPKNVLYVSHRLGDDLAHARRYGFRTAILIADGNCLIATKEDMQDEDKKPDRLLTSLRQIIEMVC